MQSVHTHFPHNKDPDEKVTLLRGDVCGFDFNREVHYITNHTDVMRANEELAKAEQRPDALTYGQSRILLKVHLVLAPSWAAPFGALNWVGNAAYDFIARTLFLSTIGGSTKTESSFVSQLGADAIVVLTIVYAALESAVGILNLAYFALFIVLSHKAGGGVTAAPFYSPAAYDFDIALGGLSFAHYILYMNVYYNAAPGSGVAYGRFVRNCRALKGGAMALLFWAYLPFLFDGTPLELLVRYAIVTGACATGALAVVRLGQAGTYFGIELGIVKQKLQYVAEFPYGTIPHPMVLCQAVAFLALYQHEGFRTAHPYLIPIHLALYACHTLQEELELRRCQLKAKAKTV